ncbi:MAG: AAA family ATPase [Pirellulaceae bacterium]|jgi:type II secretory pathway predicted ATPase ExeA|nr:AAA family ATPase [Pirellulaceae bacterium]HJN13654.1 AAA family ATPase [Pirellulaceae bacterium]
MYESFFDLSSRPFPAAPAVQYYFPTAVIEQSRQTLIRIVDRAEGPGLIVGQPGLGKTLLLRMLEHHFQNVFHCIHLASAAIESRKDLLQNVLFELDLPYRDMEEGELRLSLLDFLRPSESCPHGVLLLVDEAHTLPLQLLDEIRMITNLVRDGQPRVRLVLAGDAQLDEVFADPRLDSFNQRIAARCYLEPLNQEQTIEYVRAQISAAGGDPSEIFTDDALVAVHRASGGIPRLINQVCDHSLVMASLGGYQQLDVAGIEEAWADLQQLPGPWNDPVVQSNEGGESIVEFGSLDEDDAAQVSPFDGPLDASTDGIEQPSVEATDSILSGEVTGGEVDPPHREPIAATSEGITSPTSTDREAAAVLEGVDLPTLPDPANETPVGVDAPNSELPNSDVSIHEVVPIGHSDPESRPKEAGIGYFESNVVQFGWEANAVEPSAPVEEEPEADDTTELDAWPSSVVPTPTNEDPTPASENAPEFIDPFGQNFDEEEIVIDRYADLDGGVFAGCPRVSSEEGRTLASIVDPHPSPQLPVVEVDSVDEREAGDASREAIDAVVDDLNHDEVANESVVVTEEIAAAADDRASNAEFAKQALANHVVDTSSLSNWLFEPTTENVDMGGSETDHVTSVENKLPSSEIATAPSESSGPESADEEPSNDAPQVAVSQGEDEVKHSFLQVHDGPNINDDRDMIVIDQDKHDGVILTQPGDELAHRVEYQQLFSQLRQG